MNFKHFFFCTILFLCLFSCSTDKVEKKSETTTFLDNLKSDDFSGTILVAKNDKILEQRAYGLSSIEFDIKNNIETKFNIASITKMFTSVATLQLYEQNKIKLNVPIGTYLPDYPNKLVRDSVTIHQLLSHTSGLDNFYVANENEMKNLEYKSVSEFVPIFAKDTLLSKPGTKYNYSASGFVVLGLIIEEVSGQSYYDYLRENIFEIAEMRQTTEIEVDSIVKNKASGYTSMFGENKILKRNDYYLTKASPGGFYYSTAKDLFNFSKALRNYNLLNETTTKLMFEPKTKGYNTFIGYGIDIDQRYNQTIIGHSGGWYGIHCELMDFMEDNYTVVILSNIDDGGKKGASKVADFFKAQIADKE
ncbi:serine hydrolase domain-containing protein [Winogradskyella bathintestinalis]|uniref:Serine hydrolase domain-containing protein n=1 Tax=Winogradskyella bathintestinalis TaxID=3035208 RepID=A0ABT7ZYW8_9FLAO|nr:serine hydrolase domain-containing protein [Winogradskyella bathintestinalis]MDN3494215.1 serine hydrolase domain-containing protein [Winogradskyella bathintestinalis]